MRHDVTTMIRVISVCDTIKDPISPPVSRIVPCMPQSAGLLIFLPFVAVKRCRHDFNLPVSPASPASRCTYCCILHLSRGAGVLAEVPLGAPWRATDFSRDPSGGRKAGQQSCQPDLMICYTSWRPHAPPCTRCKAFEPRQQKSPACLCWLLLAVQPLRQKLFPPSAAPCLHLGPTEPKACCNDMLYAESRCCGLNALKPLP